MMTISNKANNQSPALNAFVKLMRAAGTVNARVHGHLTEYGLTISQFGVLEALCHLGPLCQREIGNKILKSGGNITTVIANLEKRGLIKRIRNEKDQRFYEVTLTEKGEKLITVIFPKHQDIISKEFSILNPVETDELARLCKKLGRQGG
ncbi:MAG: MarR family transcriptional regulator [Proteobacteria bacterium]|nr:MarR family transcriptional regulator [Pseudomonadota bacterium]MBU1715579.1 MarR family transcriptional regulator [Pseudomonadota bacterium]